MFDRKVERLISGGWWNNPKISNAPKQRVHVKAATWDASLVSKNIPKLVTYPNRVAHFPDDFCVSFFAVLKSSQHNDNWKLVDACEKPP